MNCYCAQWLAGAMLTSGLVLLASCRSSDVATDRTAPTASSQVQQSLPASQPFGQHWVQDKRLRELMDSIAQQNASLPAGSEDVESPQRRLQKESMNQAAVLADALSRTALQIPHVAGKDKLNENDRRGFDAQARMLYDQALELKQAAQTGKVDQMQRTLGAINSTCLSCHSRYRDLSGVLGPRASLDAD